MKTNTWVVSERAAKDSAVVLIKGHILHPMQNAYDASVVPCHPQQCLRFRWEAADVETSVLLMPHVRVEWRDG